MLIHRYSFVSRVIASLALVASLSSPIASFAQTAPAAAQATTTAAPKVAAVSFKDVPAGSTLAEAVQFLQAQGIISGYADGTFRPNQKVSRAEAMKIIIAPLLTKESLALLTSTPYTDIKAKDWYLPYVEAARQNKIIDGPPTSMQFFGARNVNKSEFLKMLLLAYRVDPNSYSEVLLPLSSDVLDSKVWFYPYIRYAVSSSIIMINQTGLLEPTTELTRGDTATFLYYFIMYRAGQRTQALLNETEMEIKNIQTNLNTTMVSQAEFASARGLLAARGAAAGAPGKPLVQGVAKIAESYRAIVRSYKAGLSQQFDEAIRLSGEAWNLAANAIQISSSLSTVGEQAQSIAKQLADSARLVKANPSAAGVPPAGTPQK